MKGIIFTEFIEMAEETFSLEVVDEMFQQVDLPSGGIYTAVGTYDHSEIVQLVVQLSKQVDMPVPQLLHAFGLRLFETFTERYGHFFAQVTSAFTFLESVEGYIHIEVRKLYPDAELPSFDCKRYPDGRMSMTYESQRGFADVAHGLIEGCFKHFGEAVEIARTDLSNGSGKLVEFVFSPVPAIESHE